MPTHIPRRDYAALYGPTAGDRVRLADTERFIEVERDLTGPYGEEVKFGDGKVIRDGMGQSQATRADGAVDTVITNALIVDHSCIYKADVGLRDGRIAAEPPAEVRADDPRHLARLARHLGNCHLPVSIEPDRLLTRRGHIIEDMLAKLGARVTHVEAPFTPEGAPMATAARTGTCAATTRITTRVRICASRAMDEALGKLAVWLSPAYPVGAYTYSHGLEWAAETVTAPLDSAGVCGLRADIASMRHETQYTRLFRS